MSKIITLDDAREFVTGLKWTFAKSYSDSFPHHYTVRRNCQDIEGFESFIQFMRENAILKPFYRNEYLYLEMDGMEYWEMGRPTKAVEVINRAPIDDDKDYRKKYSVKEGAKEKLLSKLKIRDKYIEALIKKPDRTFQENQELEWLLNSERKSPNRISHSDQQIKDYNQKLRQL